MPSIFRRRKSKRFLGMEIPFSDSLIRNILKINFLSILLFLLTMVWVEWFGQGDAISPSKHISSSTFISFVILLVLISITTAHFLCLDADIYLQKEKQEGEFNIRLGGFSFSRHMTKYFFLLTGYLYFYTLLAYYQNHVIGDKEYLFDKTLPKRGFRKTVLIVLPYILLLLISYGTMDRIENFVSLVMIYHFLIFPLIYLYLRFHRLRSWNLRLKSAPP